MTPQQPPATERDGPLLRRLGDIVQAIAVLAIVGLAIAVVDLRVSVAQSETQRVADAAAVTLQLNALKENYEIQIANSKVQMEALGAIVQRVTSGGFDANAGRALTARVEKNEDRLERVGRELATSIARLDAQIRELEKDISQTEIGKMKGRDR